MRVIYIGFVVLTLIMLSGCLNQKNKIQQTITTKEFNLRVSEVEIYPRYVKENMPFSLKFFLENQGIEDIKIWNVHITTEATCNINKNKISYYPESYCMNAGESTECTIPSGSTLIIKAEGRVNEKDADKNCEGRLTYDYKDKAEILKYVIVVNEREIITGNDIQIKGAEIKSSSQLEIKIDVDEPIIAKNEENNEFTVNFFLSNKGDGTITIDLSQISLSRDSAFNLLKCSYNSPENILKLSPYEEKTISCRFSLNEIPSIREDYRLYIEIPYVVKFTKPFIIYIKRDEKSSETLFYDITGKASRGTIYVNVKDLKRIFNEGLTPETFFKETSKMIAKKIAIRWLKKELDLMNIEFDLGIREYAKKYEGEKYGQYDGRVAAKVRAEGLARRIFENNGCDKYKDLNIEEWIGCCYYIHEVDSCREILEEDLEDCINERIEIDKPKIEKLVITPGIERNRKQIEDAILRGVEHSIREDEFVIKSLYERAIEDKLREQMQIGEDIGGVRVTANIDDLANEIIEEFIASTAQEYVKAHTVPGIINDFKEGYEKKFWEVYEKEFRQEFPRYLYEECQSKITR